MYLDKINFLCIVALFLLFFLYRPWKKDLEELDFIVNTETNFRKYTAGATNDIILTGSDVLNTTIAVAGAFTNSKVLKLDSYPNIYNTTLGTSNEYLFFTVLNETGEALTLYLQDGITAVGTEIEIDDSGLFMMSISVDQDFTDHIYTGKTIRLG